MWTRKGTQPSVRQGDDTDGSACFCTSLTSLCVISLTTKKRTTCHVQRMLYPHQGKNACAAFSVGYRKAPLESDNCFSHTVPRVSAIWHEQSALQIPNFLGSQSTVRCYANAEIIHEK